MCTQAHHNNNQAPSTPGTYYKGSCIQTRKQLRRTLEEFDNLDLGGAVWQPAEAQRGTVWRTVRRAAPANQAAT